MYNFGQRQTVDVGVLHFDNMFNFFVPLIPCFCALSQPPIGNNLETSHHDVLMISLGNWLDVVFLSTMTQQSFGKFQELYIILTKQPKIVTTAPCFQISQWHTGGHAVALRK